jgi:septal ring factor EnvC (AmiA/AmiB activator)
LLAGVAVAVFCLIAGAAYLIGHRSGVADARSQVLNSLGRQQTSLSENLQRQDQGLRELMESVGQLRQSLSRIEEQQKQGQRSFDQRIQKIDKSLRSITDQSQGSASSRPPN